MTEFTPVQYKAVISVREMLEHNLSTKHRAALKAVLDMLPDEVKTELPKEPGAYNDAKGRLTILTPRGEWRGMYGDPINPYLCALPFTSLVEDVPRPSEEDVRRILRDFPNYTKGGQESAVHLLTGQDSA